MVKGSWVKERWWWFNLAGPQVPTKAALLLLLLSWTEKKTYGERIMGQRKMVTDYSQITVMGKTDLTWGY